MTSPFSLINREKLLKTTDSRLKFQYPYISYSIDAAVVRLLLSVNRYFATKTFSSYNNMQFFLPNKLLTFLSMQVNVRPNIVMARNLFTIRPIVCNKKLQPFAFENWLMFQIAPKLEFFFYKFIIIRLQKHDLKSRITKQIL